MRIKSAYYFLGFILMLLVRCQGSIKENNDCAKFANETYKESLPDTALVNDAINYQKYLLERFGETSVKGLNYETYHLQYHSSRGYGKSVKFEKRNDGFSLTVKCGPPEESWPDCNEYQIPISKEEWDELEAMIYEFDFWTEENYKPQREVLDGCVYFLEGNRPQAEKCNKLTYNLVGRSSPEYDKIGALCEYVFAYERNLNLQYEQTNN